MEAVVGVDWIKSLEEEGVRVNTVVMDTGTTTMARICQELAHSVTKWSDVDHTAIPLRNNISVLSGQQLTLFMSSWVSPVLGWDSEVSCPWTLP